MNGNGGKCGGSCDVAKQTDPGQYGAGHTFTMRCYAARLKKQTATGIPAYLEGLERISTVKMCNVNCSPHWKAWTPQHCEFKVSAV